MEANKITLKTLLASITAILAAEVVFRPAIASLFASPLPGLGITRLAEIILLIFITLRFEKSAGAIGLAPANLLAGIKKGLIWSACFGIMAGILILVLYAMGINPLKMLRSPRPNSTPLVFVYLVVGGVMGPIAEELFFRGILYGFFRRWGVYTAVVLSTFLFILPHLSGSNLPATQLVGGVVFAIAYEKEKNLMVPIAIHCLGNLAIFSLTLFA